MSAPIGQGDIVECIDGSAPDVGDYGLDWASGRVDLGRIYRVRDVVGPAWPGDEPGLTFAEPETVFIDCDGEERFWRSSRFRPVYFRNDSIINALKQPAPKRELEDA